MRFHAMRSSLLSATTLAGLATLLSTPAVQAQTTLEAGPKTQLEEVIVTATRRETNLQNTPIAVSSVDAEFIAQTSPHDIGELAAFVPNFSAATVTGFNAASFALRGIGQNTIIVYFDSPVAVLVDDFVMPSVETQLLDPFDLQNIEVLRGPQGTLFGKNTTGGAVSVHTTQPDMNNFGGKIEAGYGSYGSWETKGALDVPIDPGKLAVRLVISHEQNDGYYKDGSCYGPITPFGPNSPWAGLKGCGPGKSVGAEDVTSGRVKLKFAPNEKFDALLQYEFVRDTSVVASTNTTSDPSFSIPVLGFPGATGNPLNSGAVVSRTDNLLGGNTPLVRVDGGHLNMDYKTDLGTVTSITGYRTQLSKLPSNYVGDPPIHDTAGETLSLFDANRTDLHETFQQEIRFASDFSGPLNFVAGGFFQDDRTSFCVAQTLGFLDLFGLSTPYGSWNENPDILCNNQLSDSYAGYTEGNYKITDKWTVTAGVRYSIDRKVWQGRQQAFTQQITGNPNSRYQLFNGNMLNAGNFALYPEGVVTDRANWSEPTYRFSTGYQATDDIYGYFTYSHGYKAGGFNDQIGSSATFGNDLAAFAQAGRPTNPEFADSYEVGVKSESFDKRVRANLTGFLVNYTDVQKSIVVPIAVDGVEQEVTEFFNAASMEIKGIEAEVQAVPLAGLTLRGNLGYQVGGYSQYVTPIPAGYNLATSPIDRTPRWQYSLDAAYSLPIREVALATFDTNVTYTDKNLAFQSLTSLQQNTWLNARYLLGASVTLSDPTDRYYVKIIGRNLTNKIYDTGSEVVAGLWQFTTYGAPRYVGVQGGLKF
jgi:iron complex outermembrane receptor protein